MGSIIALPAAVRTGTAPDVQALTYVLDHLAPGLLADALSGETPQERLARREAARDMVAEGLLDELLEEFVGDELDGIAA